MLYKGNVQREYDADIACQHDNDNGLYGSFQYFQALFINLLNKITHFNEMIATLSLILYRKT